MRRRKSEAILAVVLLKQNPRVRIYAYAAIENDPLLGSFSMAERARFELAVSCPTLVFKTSTLNHSATSPHESKIV